MLTQHGSSHTQTNRHEQFASPWVYFNAVALHIAVQAGRASHSSTYQALQMLMCTGISTGGLLTVVNAAPQLPPSAGTLSPQQSSDHANCSHAMRALGRSCLASTVDTCCVDCVVIERQGVTAVADATTLPKQVKNTSFAERVRMPLLLKWSHAPVIM